MEILIIHLVTPNFSDDPSLKNNQDGSSFFNITSSSIFLPKTNDVLASSLENPILTVDLSSNSFDNSSSVEGSVFIDTTKTTSNSIEQTSIEELIKKALNKQLPSFAWSEKEEKVISSLKSNHDWPLDRLYMFIYRYGYYPRSDVTFINWGTTPPKRKEIIVDKVYNDFKSYYETNRNLIEDGWIEFDTINFFEGGDIDE